MLVSNLWPATKKVIECYSLYIALISVRITCAARPLRHPNEARSPFAAIVAVQLPVFCRSTEKLFAKTSSSQSILKKFFQDFPLDFGLVAWIKQVWLDKHLSSQNLCNGYLILTFLAKTWQPFSSMWREFSRLYHQVRNAVFLNSARGIWDGYLACSYPLHWGGERAPKLSFM